MASPVEPGPGKRSGWVKTTLPYLVWVLVLGAGGYLAFVTKDRWLEKLTGQGAGEAAEEAGHSAVAAGNQVLLSDQAQKNLHLQTKPLVMESFWKTITVPGIVIDRPGFSDRGVVAPATGVISRIHRVPGETVRVGEPLFTIRLLSESLHLTQTDLFKATQDIRLAQAQRQRIAELGDAVSGARLIEVENQITRLEVATKAYRQELLNRGLSAEQVKAAEEGKFVSEITINAPAPPTVVPKGPNGAQTNLDPGLALLEIQELKAELGHQVQAGQTLCLIANHQLLCIEGSAFREELPLLENALRGSFPLEVDFGEVNAESWPPLKQGLVIHSISNSIDPETRSFHFIVRFENQFRLVEKEGKTQVFWRYRPGQRVRVLLRTEKLDNVFVLPAQAVVREGGDAFVFRQNGDVFDRKPVRVLHQERSLVVIANDGSVPAGIFVVQNSAAQLNRMIKAQAGSAGQGFHIHADGSVHKGGH